MTSVVLVHMNAIAHNTCIPNITIDRIVDCAGCVLRTVDAADARPEMRTVPKSHGRSSSLVLNVLNLLESRKKEKKKDGTI